MNDPVEQTTEPTPSPSPRPITTTDLFFPPKNVQFHSEYNLRDHIKNPQPSESIPQNINDTPHRSLSKVLSDQTFDTMDRTITPSRRYSSSDIDQQSIHLMDSQQKQLIEQQKKRRIYNFNHTLFSNIYKRTQRLSSTDSHVIINPAQTRERSHTRQRNQSIKQPGITPDEPTTSDRVYSRALENNTLNLEQQYRTALSIPDGVPRRPSSRQRLSSSGYTSDSQVENNHNHHQQQKSTKLNVEPTTRVKKLSFLSARRRASYYPAETSNVLTDDQKRKRDVIWPLKRSYSFDTPFHRETIEALNKGMYLKFYHTKKKIISISIDHKTNSFTEQGYSPIETCK